MNDNLIRSKKFFSSWSGGKDSCLSLYRAIQNGGRPDLLFTMMVENGKLSRSHGLTPDLLEAQAASLNLPLIRVGFPVHDRVNGSRLLHLGYRGAQQLFDKIANIIIIISSVELTFAFMGRLAPISL